MKVKVSENLCIGCGACQALDPKHFELNDNGVSEVVKEPSEAEKDVVQNVVESCPTSAISIEE